jgi:long-chain fatty acid transport protein
MAGALLRKRHGKPVAHKQVALAAASLLALSAVPAHAAGFALREYSLSAEGAAFAGSSAMSDEPGGLAYNPATSSGVDQWDGSFTLNAIYPSVVGQFTTATTSAATPTGGPTSVHDYLQDAYEPGLALRYRLSPKLTAGLAVTAPWGLGTKYNDDWAGRYYALESRLLTVNTSPSLAYQIAPELTLSVGAQIEYATGKLSNAIDFGTIGAVNLVPGAVPGTQDGKAEYTASDWGFGFTLGALWQPRSDLRIGASYRSELHHELQGDVNFTLDTAGIGAILSGATGAFVDTTGRASVTLPAVASFGVAYDLTPKLSLMGEFDYTWWSSFDQLRIKFANPFQPDDFQIYDYKNTFFASLGARYRPDADWVLRAGVAFDQSPTRDTTRDPRVPDADRTWLALSVGYWLTAHDEIEIGYAHLFFPPEPISLSALTPGNEARGNLVGTTDADADVITLQFTFR